MKALAILTSLALTAGFAQSANALDLLKTGTISSTIDRVEFDFAVGPGPGPVALWTDSFNSGANFDPVLTLFVRENNDWLLLDQNDDFGDQVFNQARTGPARLGQTNSTSPAGGDSLMDFTSLAAGQYKLVLTAYPNASGALVNQSINSGWAVPIEFPPQSLAGRGAYSVHLDNVQDVQAVPEPATWGLLLAGLGAVGVARRRSAKA